MSVLITWYFSSCVCSCKFPPCESVRGSRPTEVVPLRNFQGYLFDRSRQVTPSPGGGGSRNLEPQKVSNLSAPIRFWPFLKILGNSSIPILIFLHIFKDTVYIASYLFGLMLYSYWRLEYPVHKECSAEGICMTQHEESPPLSALAADATWITGIYGLRGLRSRLNHTYMFPAHQ